jgi:hypothetical protein
MLGSMSDTSTVKSRADRVCIYPGCGYLRTSRGLCGPHYRMALARVKSGRTTWEALEADGKAFPPNQSLRGQGKWFIR